MRQLLDFVISIVLFLCFVAAGLAAGYGAGLAFSTLSHAGWFNHWMLLDSSMKFAEIVDVSSQAVWARTDNGDLYNWDLNCFRNRQCNTWIEVASIPANLHMAGEQPMEKGSGCSDAPSRLRTPPGEMVECARAWYAGPEIGEINYYALSREGRVWLWQYSTSMIQDFWLFLLCYLVGFTLGLVAFVLVMKRWHRSRAPKTPLTEPNEALHGA